MALEAGRLAEGAGAVRAGPGLVLLLLVLQRQMQPQRVPPEVGRCNTKLHFSKSDLFKVSVVKW